MLKLVDIKKDYKVANTFVHALKGVTLNFRKREFVCILGASGCGKTTLLNIIGGLDHYTSGDLIIDGKSTKRFGDADWDVYRNHRIGFIFQSYNLIPHQTVLGNVEIALTIAGISREERRARAKQALERVGLKDEIHKRPNQLSGGQCQRVAIARALVNNPEILLADEPTGALDSETSVQIMDLIKEIAGERLVIMVTHNPELAEQYASRIVRLKDGLVDSDSAPCGDEEEREASAQEIPQAEQNGETKQDKEQKKPKKKREKKPRARMSFSTSMALSARNLLTKKGRTALTAIGGSIGIISVCLVLALSSGFQNYIRRTEEDMLSYYPVTVTESAYDMASVMTSFTAPSQMPDLSQIGDKVYVDSFLTGLANGMAVRNDISENYLTYLEGMDTSWYAEIQYGHGAGLADNLFTAVETGGIEIGGELKPQVTQNLSLTKLKNDYISELISYASEYDHLTGMAEFFGNIVNAMPGTSDLSSDRYGQYVLSQYDVVEGTFPQNENEAVLVISSNNAVTDLTLAQLGFLNEKQFLSLFPKEGETVEPMYVPYDEIVGKHYTLFYNNAVYSENPDYVKPTVFNPVAGYPFTYQGTRENLAAQEGEGINLTITGILRLKEGLTYGCLTSGLNLPEATVNGYIARNKEESKIVEWVKNDSRLALFGETSLNLAPCSASQFDNYYYAISQFDTENFLPPDSPIRNLRVTTDTERVVRYLGGDDTPNRISIYATDFEGKEMMLDYLDAWNRACETGGEIGGVVLTEGDKITYSDTVGLLMGMMQTMLDVITYVLVAFTAISLVVSSVMIGIITYVSVVERVKEIGVLRSLGARKRDIKNLFNSETFIIGLSAGLFGVVVTYILSIFVNLIIESLTGIAGIAALSPLSALIMVVVSVALTLISGLIPASAAAKKDPVIALRTE